MSDDNEMILITATDLDYSRACKIVERDERGRKNARQKQEYNTKFPIINLVKIDNIKHDVVLPFLITFESEWKITVKCPHCKEAHVFSCGSEYLPDISLKTSPCKKFYEIVLTDKWLKVVKSLYKV